LWCLWPKLPQALVTVKPQDTSWATKIFLLHLRPSAGEGRDVDTRPRYEQVAVRLRGRISSGELTPGDRLPSENQLSTELDVSRDVARKALQVLVNEGLIESLGRQQGYRVRDVQPLTYHATRSELASRRRNATADIWMTDVMEAGRRPAIALSVYTDRPSVEVAQLLGVNTDEKVTIRRRLRLVDDQAYAISVAHFAPWAVKKVPELATPTDLQPGPAALLAKSGHEPVRILDRIRLRMPTPEERDILRMPPGVPVAEHVRTPYDERGTAIRVTVTTLPGDRWTLEYEVDPRDA
jgi:GntR family transcriptional regulator